LLPEILALPDRMLVTHEGCVERVDRCNATQEMIMSSAPGQQDRIVADLNRTRRRRMHLCGCCQ
jgi:hypothetical protein